MQTGIALSFALFIFVVIVLVLATIGIVRWARKRAALKNEIFQIDE